MKQNLRRLLNEEESIFLDFKQTWHENNAELVHDILSLSNSNSNSDKYLIFGIKDKTKEIVGIDTDKNRKNLENILDLIKNSNFNIKPIIDLKTITASKKQIDILIIKNSTNKPFFLTTDKTVGNKTVRAGVIYTRDGNTNTPLNRSASEYQIAHMWQERFGLLLSPLERLNLYIKDTENWTFITIDENSIFYYKKYPEYTIELKKTNDTTQYKWQKAIGKATNYEIYFKFHSTVIQKKYAAYVDDIRYFILQPKYLRVYYKEDFSKYEIYDETEFSKAFNKFSQKEYSDFLPMEIYYDVKDSFNYCVEKLYNSEAKINHFFEYGTLAPFFLLKPTDSIKQKCLSLFKKNKKQYIKEE